MLELESCPGGVILSVRACPGSRRNEIRGIQDGALKVCVTQVPEKGKANKAIIACLAKWLGLRKSQLELISGETAPQKKFLVRQVEKAEISARIQRCLSKNE
jgi:uncharacterized protein (TIGR00251 family)